MRLAEDVADIGVIDQRPIQDGRNMTMLLSPVAKKPVEEEATEAVEAKAAEAAPDAVAEPPKAAAESADKQPSA